ncbi:flavodoxin family protein [Verticiella sediminum]|uniref:Flavodoxin family protein n=1 Tax=Verticiella sediminum TaxID=1247510 RepID=A0A556AC25_9BURK|nr:NAD(P)H-dependent oxidoreductase [Verticiella sediminum]TSH90442.1 flavodoxin family protein [Verticiella sediminum]
MSLQSRSPRLLIVWHSRTGAARQMAQAAADGAHAAADAMDEALDVHLLAADEVQADSLLEADAYLFCAPENLATLSGEMKAFFDRNYYAVLDAIAGRAYAVMIAAGTDGEGARRQVERIASGWRLRAAAPPFVYRNGAQTPEAILAPKTVAPDVLAQCGEIGGTLAAGLLL